MQLLYIGMVWWTSIKKDSKEEVEQPQVEERVAEREHPSRQSAAS
jgi:hypothetical protein